MLGDTDRHTSTQAHKHTHKHTQSLSGTHATRVVVEAVGADKLVQDGLEGVELRLVHAVRCAWCLGENKQRTKEKDKAKARSRARAANWQ